MVAKIFTTIEKTFIVVHPKMKQVVRFNAINDILVYIGKHVTNHDILLVVDQIAFPRKGLLSYVRHLKMESQK